MEVAGGGNAMHLSSGAGGSSFISGHNGCNAIDFDLSTSISNIVHTGNAIFSYNSKQYKFENTTMIDGNGYAWTTQKGELQAMPNYDGGYYSSGVGNTGDGHARITFISRN